MSFFVRKPLFTIGLLVILLIGLPATVFLFQMQQELRSKAEQTVSLFFSPPTSDINPLVVPAGTNFSLDVLVNPGANSVSLVKGEILYDPTKFEIAPGLPFQQNQSAFPQLVEGPTYSSGKVSFTLSVGTDMSRAIKQQTRIGTITFRALDSAGGSETTTLINFGQNSQALSVSDNSSPTENVIANTSPATIYIGSLPVTAAPTMTPSPTPEIETGPTPNFSACADQPSDAVLVMDKSGSMNDKIGSSGTKIQNAKKAAKTFVDNLAKNSDNKVGLASFATTGTQDLSLTNNFSSVKTKVDSLAASGWTCIECGIKKANQEIAAHQREGIKSVVVLLTDGRANVVEGSSKTVSNSVAEQKAIDAAKAGNAANDTIFYTIGLGNDVNGAFLEKIADLTGGKYYASPTTDQLNSIYTEISKVVAKGSVNGVVFTDSNKNGVFDTNEAPLSGWKVQLFSSASTTPQTYITDEGGTYAIPNLCDGSYTLKQVKQSGWTQTVPANNANYPITIIKGDVSADKNFGNIKLSRCSDSIDNDNNGFTDSKDSTCHTDGNPNNPNTYDPSRDGETGGNTCADSKDNNNNGVIDGADPVCHPGGDPTKPWDPNLPEINPTPTPTMTPTPTLTPTPSPTATPMPSATPTVAPSATSIPTATTIPTTLPTLTHIPTPTSKAVTMQLSLNVLLHGVGTSGDNTNPTASSLSNKNPLHPAQIATVMVYNSANQLIASSTAQITYASESGSFKGIVDLTDPITTGIYTVKVDTERHLTRLIAGIQSLTANQNNQLPTSELITGDITNDNQLDIRDYNLLLDCYSDLSTAAACNDTKKAAADINDDGPVNQVDYNLFLREISTQPGE
jgi:Mg-chelatase subunit ChlD